MNRDEIAERVRGVDVWYHVLELAPGLETPGMYDMRPTVPHYRFPASLAGRSVIDVGASNGFFSFHFEKLGARRVVATNLASYRQHDYPRWYLEKLEREKSREELARFDYHQSTGGFEVAKACLGSKVEHLLTPIYALPSVTTERFDFGFCGSVLVHLRDPVLGLEAIREVLAPGAQLIVATSIDTTQPEQSYGVFNGKPEEVSWWVLSPAALMRMCAMAGFSDVAWTGSFVIASKHGYTDTIGVARMIRR
jgi:tRNA (mo5U34)-methyltransferase